MPHRFLTSALLALLLLLHSVPAGAAGAEGRALVRELIDRGEPAQALELLESMSGNKLAAEELLLRGMARIMLGELRGGGADLEKAVDLDPTLREGWLNLAGLEIAEADYESALELLMKAHDIDPKAADIHLNLGAVLLMLGRGEDAADRFDRYLKLEDSAEAHFLVAANFALVGDGAAAVEHLGRAIELDERMRMRARRDDRFAGLDSLDYRVLLYTDSYQPPEGHRQVAAAFQAPYSQKDPRLLYAVLDSLQETGLGYDPEVESTARWALIWGEKMRIKVHTQDNGTGVVSLSAPPESISAEDWQRASQDLFRAIHGRLGG